MIVEKELALLNSYLEDNAKLNASRDKARITRLRNKANTAIEKEQPLTPVPTVSTVPKNKSKGKEKEKDKTLTKKTITKPGEYRIKRVSIYRK